MPKFVPLSSRLQLLTSSSWLRCSNLTTMGFRHRLSGFFPPRELIWWKEILLTVLIGASEEIPSPSLGIFLSEIHKGRFSHATGLEIQDSFLHALVFFSELDHSLSQGFHWVSESLILCSESDLLLAKLQPRSAWNSLSRNSTRSSWALRLLSLWLIKKRMSLEISPGKEALLAIPWVYFSHLQFTLDAFALLIGFNSCKCAWLHRMRMRHVSSPSQLWCTGSLRRKC